MLAGKMTKMEVVKENDTTILVKVTDDKTFKKKQLKGTENITR